MPINPNRMINTPFFTPFPNNVTVQNEQNQTTNNQQIPIHVHRRNITPEMYRQYMLQCPNFSLKTEQANNSDADMHEVYILDKNIFEDIGSYDSYEEFIRYVNNNNLSTYVLKDESDNNKIIGYYQLEPINDGNLYIDSIGLKPEYRNTRKGYYAIQKTWERILNYAQTNNVDTLSLHVNMNDRNLLRMYQNLGFTIKETLENYYDNGFGAYYMEKPVENVAAEEVPTTETNATNMPVIEEPLSDTETTDVEPVTVVPETDEIQVQENEQVQEPTEEVEQISQISETEQAERLYQEKLEHAKQELLEMGVEEKNLDSYLSVCNETFMKRNSNNVFNDDLFKCAKYLIKIEQDYANNEKVFSLKEMNDTEYRKTINALCIKQDDGQYKIRTELLPYLRRFAGNNMSFFYYGDILNIAKQTSPDGTQTICEEVLDIASSLGLYMETYKVKDILQKCIMQDENLDYYLDKNALSAVRSAVYSLDKNFTGGDIEKLLEVSKRKDDEGNIYFDKNLFNELKTYLKTSGNLSYSDRIFFSTYSMEQAYQDGCDLGAMLKFGKYIFRNDDIQKISRQIDYKQRDHFENNIFNSCCYMHNEPEYINGTYVTNKKLYFDHRVKNKFIELATAEPQIFENINNIPKILSACKEQQDSYYDYKFNPELINKAIQLKNIGVQEDNIAEILECCKLKNVSSYSNEVLSIKFNEDIFNTIINTYQNSDGSLSAHTIAMKINYSKETKQGEEIFKPEIYARLEQLPIIDEDNYYYVNTDSFFIKQDKYNQIFDIDLYERACSIKNYDMRCICTKTKSKNYVHQWSPHYYMIDAYKELQSKNMKFTPKKQDNGSFSSNCPEYHIMMQCKDDIGVNCDEVFSTQAHRAACELLDKGYDGRDVLNIIYCCKEHAGDCETKGYSHRFIPERYNVVKSLLDKGVDIENAGIIAQTCVINRKTNEIKLNGCLELFNMGIKNPAKAMDIAGNDNFTYEKLKEAYKRNLPVDIISACKENGVFKDSLLKLAFNLQERNFSPDNVLKLMNSCMEKFETTNPKTKSIEMKQHFNYEMFHHINDLEVLGINKDNISKILDSCKKNNIFCKAAYDKISSLYYKEFDDNGIAKFLEYCYQDGKFDENKYQNLLVLTAKHKLLKGQNYNDDYVITQLRNNASNIENVQKTFGKDVVDFAMGAKIDNYINFISQCQTLLMKTSPEFIEDLKNRLSELPSPELKVKRLRVLGGLAKNVDEAALKTLSTLIKSPKMTEQQIQLANAIFSDDTTDYETNVENFINKIKTPTQYRNTVKEYLLKERLDKQIDRPKSIEEQMEQMDVYAQQMLSNPKIPLDKKLKYIDEFRAKKADMQSNPTKYTLPKIFPKPLEGLKRVVEAYSNIPNDDTLFNSSITTTMYNNLGIEVNKDLLEDIHYDAKYFDKLFAAQSDFKNNFQRLIELVKLNPHRPLNKIRIELPEEGTEKYNEYEKSGLIEQIKANLDTIRQFKEAGLDFDKWNTFDKNLKGNIFTVEADKETAYENIKFDLMNLFDSEEINKINPEEKEKLIQNLKSNGFVIFNNKIYKNNQLISNSDLDRLTEIVAKHFSTEKYWKNENIQQAEISEDEKNGITAFMDHFNDISNHLKEVHGSQTVENIYMRLSDDNNIGRNIFFGNHVGCCNSVESSYAGYSAPLHLLNNFNRGIELVDKYGNSYGNSMCFFAHIDGQLAFVIDSFEANGKLASNPIVTDELINFGKKVCKEMGREDAIVLIGPNFNHINKSRLESTKFNNMKIIGTVSEKTYCDSVGGKNVKQVINEGKNDITMYRYK